jgi:membrane-associated phospholipid phosphatase
MGRRPRIALLGALGCLAGLVLVWVAAFVVPVGNWLDASTLTGFVDLKSPSVDPLANRIGSLADPSSFFLAGAVLTAVALARGRVRVAAVVPVILLAASFTTELLKPALADPQLSHLLTGTSVGPARWPSGHATAAMSLALCAILVAPRRARPLVAALAGALAVAVGYSVLTLGMHFPSDVLGGFLVAGFWTALGVAALWAAAARWPERAGRGRSAAVRVRDALAPSGLAAAAAVACAGAIALARPESTLAYARGHTAFVAGAAAIAALGAAMAAGLAVALRR